MYLLSCKISLQQVFVDQIFRIFDKDGNGSIDFKVLFSTVILEKLPFVTEHQNLTTKAEKNYTSKEFMLATDMTASGSPEEKLRWAFKMYDKVKNLSN